MTKYLAVVSGKGGAGKTTTAVSLAQALTNLGRSVILVDANLATPNVSLQLGLKGLSGYLNNFIRHEADLQQVTYRQACGFSVIPASSSQSEYLKTDSCHLSELFEHLDEAAEFVLIDAPSGFGKEVEAVLKNSDEVLIVANPTHSSVQDAKKTAELAKSHNNYVAGILINMAHNDQHELSAAEIEQQLGHPILARVRFDHKVRKAQHRCQPVNHLYPHSRVAREFNKVAEFLVLK